MIRKFFLRQQPILGFSFFQKKQPSTPMPDNSRVEALKSTVDSLTAKNNSLQKQVNDMKGQVSTSTQNKSALQKQVDDLTRKNANQATQITTLQKENANLKSQVNSYKPDAERWRRQLEVNR